METLLVVPVRGILVGMPDDILIVSQAKQIANCDSGRKQCVSYRGVPIREEYAIIYFVFYMLDKRGTMNFSPKRR